MIHIDYRDPRPIYEQVKDGLRRLVVIGALPAGEKLPSVRELATTLTINPNTIQRAYRELESEGYIVSVPGKGSFAAERREENEEHKQELLKKLREVARELRWLGMSGEEIAAAIEREDKGT